MIHIVVSCTASRCRSLPGVPLLTRAPIRSGIAA